MFRKYEDKKIYTNFESAAGLAIGSLIFVVIEFIASISMAAVDETPVSILSIFIFLINITGVIGCLHFTRKKYVFREEVKQESEQCNDYKNITRAIKWALLPEICLLAYTAFILVICIFGVEVWGEIANASFHLGTVFATHILLYIAIGFLHSNYKKIKAEYLKNPPENSVNTKNCD